MEKTQNEKGLTIKMPVDLHRKIKVLAANQGKSIKQCLLDGLDAAFPGWREEPKK